MAHENANGFAARLKKAEAVEPTMAPGRSPRPREIPISL
jgi:hypothetical protein